MDRTKIIFIFFTILTCGKIYSQIDSLSRHSEVNEFVKELVGKKIDTICDYETFSRKKGQIVAQYIFWKENGKTKLKKIEQGKTHEIIDTQIEEIWQYFFSNLEVMKNEEVKSFQYLENKEIIDVASYGEGVKEFNLFLNGYILKCWTEDSYFSKTQKIGKKIQTNINFEDNKNSKLKFVIDKLDMAIKNLEKDNVFK
jgi:hypothetical protein